MSKVQSFIYGCDAPIVPIPQNKKNPPDWRVFECGLNQRIIPPVFVGGIAAFDVIHLGGHVVGQSSKVILW